MKGERIISNGSCWLPGLLANLHLVPIVPARTVTWVRWPSSIACASQGHRFQATYLHGYYGQQWQGWPLVIIGVMPLCAWSSLSVGCGGV
jgi:hypothetical protein